MGPILARYLGMPCKTRRRGPWFARARRRTSLQPWGGCPLPRCWPRRCQGLRRRPTQPRHCCRGLFGLEDNFHSAPWTEAARGYLAGEMARSRQCQRDIARALGRSVQSCEAQAFKMHLNRARGRPKFRAVVTDNFTTGRRAAEAAAERIRAYWARQGRPSGWNWNLCRVRQGKATARGRQNPGQAGVRRPPVPGIPARSAGRSGREIPYKSERRMLHAGPPPPCPCRRWSRNA